MFSSDKSFLASLWQLVAKFWLNYFQRVKVICLTPWAIEVNPHFWSFMWLNGFVYLVDPFFLCKDSVFPVSFSRYEIILCGFVPLCLFLSFLLASAAATKYKYGLSLELREYLSI